MGMVLKIEETNSNKSSYRKTIGRIFIQINKKQRKRNRKKKKELRNKIKRIKEFKEKVSNGDNFFFQVSLGKTHIKSVFFTTFFFFIIA